MMTWEDMLRRARRDMLLQIGNRLRWNQSAMAAEMGVHRNTVGRLLRDAEIDIQACNKIDGSQLQHLGLMPRKYRRLA